LNPVEAELTPWGAAVQNYLQLRNGHARTGRCAGVGWWALQLLAIALAGSTAFLFIFNGDRSLVQAIPAAVAGLLTAFSRLVNWRRLSKTRLAAARDMDREYRRATEHRQAYASLDACQRTARFSDEIERIDDRAEKVGWLDSPVWTRRRG
jgi:hypothetical protein